jgi:Toprim domain
VIDLATIDQIIGGRVGTFDVPCPECSPFRRGKNQRKPALRIWRVDAGFAGYYCAHCQAKGHARDQHAPPPDPLSLERARAEALQHKRQHEAARLSKAQALWSMRQAVRRSPAETYLREVRGYRGRLPATLGFLPARGIYEPSLIAAFGIAEEPEPGVLSMLNKAVRGVHITRLLPDGSDKAGSEADKITIGHCMGSPIVLAPPNDLLGLAIAEGIEDALSLHEATGLGAWAAASAARLPALAMAIPGYIEAVTLAVDDDLDGRKFMFELAELLDLRGFEVSILDRASAVRAAA